MQGNIATNSFEQSLKTIFISFHHQVHCYNLSPFVTYRELIREESSYSDSLIYIYIMCRGLWMDCGLVVHVSSILSCCRYRASKSRRFYLFGHKVEITPLTCIVKNKNSLIILHTGVYSLSSIWLPLRPTIFTQVSSSMNDLGFKSIIEKLTLEIYLLRYLL